MSAIESDPGWYERMAQRAAARRPPEPEPLFNRDEWPVPRDVQLGASARDAFLWYIHDGWYKIFGDAEPIDTVLDHDFGLHVLRKGPWQLTLVNLEQFPSHSYDDEPGDVRERGEQL